MGFQERFDELLAEAVPLAGERLAEHAGGSFLEKYLEAALKAALVELVPAISVSATGHSRVSVPNWQPKMGGFDLRVRLSDQPEGEALVETKVWDVEQTLWDLFKLAAGLTMPGVGAAYLVLARHGHRWQDGECVELFAEGAGPRRWTSGTFFEDWKAAWTELLGGGTARPLSAPAEIETAFIASAPAVGFPPYEIRAVAVRLVPGADVLPFDGNWPAAVGDTPLGPEFSGEEGDQVDPAVEDAIMRRANPSPGSRPDDTSFEIFYSARLDVREKRARLEELAEGGDTQAMGYLSDLNRIEHFRGQNEDEGD
jgi:hypothetical protein